MIVRLIIACIFKRKEVGSVMINLFVMQVNLGWLKVEDIPEPYHTKVVELLEVSNMGLE